MVTWVVSPASNVIFSAWEAVADHPEPRSAKTTVRETEQMVRKYLEQPDAEELGKKAVRWEQKEWEKKLSGQLGRSIKIRKKSDGSGALLLSYKDAADLESLLNKLT